MEAAGAIPGSRIFISRRGLKVKEGIHPKYEPVKIKCACGEVIETRSTRKNISVELCSKCHPFFTGKQKIIDTEGRVERFKKKYGTKA